MTLLSAFVREIKFMARDRAVFTWMCVVLCLSSFAVWSGLAAVDQQRASIDYALELDQQDRSAQIAKFKDWGSAAYYSFHFTYDSPSDFAFASMGQRDQMPWKHRVRMLALEGQIYERDAEHPVIALIGRFDFSFLAAFVLPLVLIILLHDLRAGERAAGRYDLLVATSCGGSALWLVRAFVRAMAVVVCLVIPLLFGGLIAGTSLSTLLWASLLLLAYSAFWTLLCSWFATWRLSGDVILVALIGVWVLQAVILPAGGRLAIDNAVSVPAGAEILMMQRETVNDAWDLPKKATMDPFVDRHPEWSEYAQINASFEWKWYYAFQQVGDQKTEPYTMAYRDGRLQRDRLAARWSLFTPSAFLERSLQALARTDLRAAMAYENHVRKFHSMLRAFYYPKLFQDAEFDKEALNSRPEFQALN